MNRYSLLLGKAPPIPETTPLDKCIASLIHEFFSIYGGVKQNLDWAKKTENAAISDAHHGLGRRIRNEMGLYAGTSDLFRYFKQLGIHHPDDMSGIVLRCLHRKLNNKPWDIESQIKHYQDYWSKITDDEDSF